MSFHPLRLLTRDARVGLRLTIAVILPLCAIVGLASMLSMRERDTATTMQRFDDLVDLSIDIGNLVHELQKERGMSAVFLNSKGEQMARELPDQRRLTSEKVKEIQARLSHFDLKAYDASVQRAVEAGMAALGQLDAKRGDISAFRMQGTESNAYFSAANARFLETLREASKTSRDPALTSAFLAYYSYMAAKERSGQERATGAVGFASGQFTPAQYSTYVSILADQRSFFDNFAAYATAAQNEFARQTVSGSIVDEVERMRKVAVEGGAGGSLAAVSGTDWFRATTARIDLMKKVENQLASDLSAYAKEQTHEASASFLHVFVGSVAIFILSAFLTWFLARSITRPLKGMTEAMRTLAAGNTNTEIPAKDNKDEIGQMAGAVQIFKDNMIEGNRLKAEQEELKARAEVEKKEAMAAMADQFQASVGNVIDSVSSSSTQLQSTASSMSATAEETGKQAGAVAAASEQASANVQTVASAAEELSSSISEISRQVGQSSKIANQAVSDAAKANEMVQGLVGASQKIGDVVALITDIAEQTNLLALNATIEAARAGEAGKGFAVVAAEVKNLANQTAKATDEIGGQITGIQSATQDAVKAIETIGKTIGEINEIASAIAAAVEEQGAATKEIARNVEQAAAGTQEVSSNISGVNQAANDTGSAASQVLTAAQGLAAQSGEMKTLVEGFISQMRAA